MTASCLQAMPRKLLPQQSGPPALQSGLLLIAVVRAAADQPVQCHGSCAQQAQHAMTASCLQVMLRKLLPQHTHCRCACCSGSTIPVPLQLCPAGTACNDSYLLAGHAAQAPPPAVRAPCAAE